MRWTTAQHCTATKRWNELNVRATGLVGVFLLLLFASFPICILFQGDLHLGRRLFICTCISVWGIRLQSGVRKVFLSRQKLNWNLKFDDDTAEWWEKKERIERRKEIKSGLYDDIDDDT
jgi:hypothetical protein